MTDQERIAALLDGRLGARERDELLARLAESDDDLALLADAAAVSGELEEEGAGTEPARADGDEVAGVVPLHTRRRPWARRALAVAAVAAGLAVVPLLWMQRGGRGADADATPVVLLAADGAGLPAGWEARPWGTTRGAGDPLTEPARAVRVGALLTDLELAVRGRDPAAARLAGEVALLLDAIPAAGPVAARYYDIEERAGEAPERLLPLLAAGRGEAATMVGAERMEVGEWAEAGRIAAASRDAAFFRAPETAEAFGRAAAVAGLPAEARDALERLRLATGEGGEPEWEVLARDLATVLGVLGS